MTLVYYNKGWMFRLTYKGCYYYFSYNEQDHSWNKAYPRLGPRK